MQTVNFKNGSLSLGDGVELMRSMVAGSVDLICSDVPYRVIAGGNKDSKSPKGMLSKNDGKIFKHNNIKASIYLAEMYRILKAGGDCYIFTNDKNLEIVLREARKAGFGFHTIVMWRKNNKNPSRYFMQQCEYVLFFYKSPARKINDCGVSQFIDAIEAGQLPVAAIDNPKSPKKHPTEKPVEFMKVLIEASTHYGQTVFDPFAGSAATLVAAIKTGRRYAGCEIDPKYYYGAIARLAEVDGL